MKIAGYVVGQAPRISELVNMATARYRGGRPVTPLTGDHLVAAFAALGPQHTAAALRAAPGAGGRLAELARRLRAAMLAGSAAAIATHINALIGHYGAQPYLDQDVDQPFHLHFHGTGETIIEALGGEFATALALIVDGYGTDRFGQCAAPRCQAVFIDLTRNRSRRFCTTACTARTKTAAYRTRQRT